MAQLAMLSMVVLLANHAMADILVQPGYGQPRSTSQPHSTEQHHQHPIVQPPETLPHSRHEDQHSMDPGYHLELHPVYTGSYDIPHYAMPPVYHQPHLMPPMSRAAYRRLLSKNAGLGIVGMPAEISPQYYQYVSPAVHSRNKRSNTEELNVAAQRDKRDKDDVATKSSLNDDTLSVVDSQNQDEKRVNTRQSATGTLLGLNPANMYPALQQYRSMNFDPTVDLHQEILKQQTRSQINPRSATQNQISTQQQGAVSAKIALPNANMENLQRAMLLQHAAPQQQQQQQQEIFKSRNYPDPRPISASVQLSTNSVVEKPKDRIESQTPTVAKHSEISNDEEIVGTKFGGLHKVNVLQHVHQHAKLKDVGHTLGESYTNTKPSYVVYNDGTTNNLAMAQTGAQQVAQVYQFPSVQGTNCSPNVQYIVAPQTYPFNYAGNYLRSYPYSPAASTFRICFKDSYNVQPIAYQLL